MGRETGQENIRPGYPDSGITHRIENPERAKRIFAELLEEVNA